jgi:hypothetical protein
MLVYASSASVADESDVKEALGYMEFSWCMLSFKLGLGTAIGPICAAIFYYFGDYNLPFSVFGTLMISTVPIIYNLNIPDSAAEGEEHSEPEFLKSLMNLVKVF